MVHDGRPPPGRRLGPPKSKSAPPTERREIVASVLPPADLLHDLNNDAQKELANALIADGAKDEKAKKAIREISLAVAFFIFERGRDTQGEIERLAEALRQAQTRIEGLSTEARVALRIRLARGRTRFGLFGSGRAQNVLENPSLGLPSMSPREAFDAVEQALPYAIGPLAIRARKKGPTPDRELRNLIHQTAKIWLDASAQWPSGQIEHGMATAPLYSYLARHSGAHLTPSTWARALGAAKQLEYGILGSGTDGRRRRRHK